MNVGTEWLVDAEGCSSQLLCDLNTIKRVCDLIIADLDLRVVGRQMWHQFPTPGGVTGLVLLTESHLACHTYPESGIATFNLYCCRLRPEWPWEDRLSEMLGASRVTVCSLTRGATLADQEALLVETSNFGREV
jgi:S-adenosylmethionine decarboxylase